MKLNKREKQGFEALKKLAESYLNDDLNYTLMQSDIGAMHELGIELNIVTHHQSGTVKRGKEDTIELSMSHTTLPAKMKSKTVSAYLPFQIKIWKEDSNKGYVVQANSQSILYQNIYRAKLNTGSY